MKQPRVGHFYNPDIIIDESGQTWVKEIAGWGVWSGYVKIEELRAADNDCSRNTRPNPSGRFSKGRSRTTDRHAGGPYGFDPGSEPFPHSGSVLNDQQAIHELLEKWFADYYKDKR